MIDSLHICSVIRLKRMKNNFEVSQETNYSNDAKTYSNSILNEDRRIAGSRAMVIIGGILILMSWVAILLYADLFATDFIVATVIIMQVLFLRLVANYSETK